MKVNSNNKPIVNKKIDNSREQLERKLEEKFGDKFKAKKEKDRLSLSKKEKAKKPGHEFALKSDIESNNASSELTQEKLKGLLQSGAFHFNDNERTALSEILGV